MRIISGRWRRRTLPITAIDGLRPTGDRVRETLFNWLMPYTPSASVLDLFSGTGALGLEALSRGAGFVQFIELHKQAAEQLRQNLLSLDAELESYRLHCGDAMQWLEIKQDRPFDLVFVDPPFQAKQWDLCCALLNSTKILSPEALIYVESPVETKLNMPQNWRRFRSLKAGNVQAQLFSVDL